ncbi:hypothetical protein ACJZ2D_009085 [Fusarium nematophilum]
MPSGEQTTKNEHGPKHDPGLHPHGSDYTVENIPRSLRAINKSHTINFPILSTYTAWGPVEAFRELIQNWMDGMIKSFQLPSLGNISVVRQERTQGRDTEIVYKVLGPSTRPDVKKNWMGYVRFRGRDGVGTVEVVNRLACLETWHLDMGGTSKANDVSQAGEHGEGLKIALLVLQRRGQNHSVCCYSGGVRLDFNFTTQGRLVARLVRMGPKRTLALRSQASSMFKEGLVPFEPDAGRDLRFVIGELGPGRDEEGKEVKRQPVTLEEFEHWCKTAIFFQDIPEGGMTLTPCGDLITDPSFCGKLYLRSLLLNESRGSSSASITGKPLKYGYSFKDGRTNRERQYLSSPAEECRAIFAIWNRALQVRPELVGSLSDMLNCSDREYADVAMAKEVMEGTTVWRLKEHLFSDRSKWYRSVREKDENPELETIIRGLGREPFELQDSYWSILDTHSMVRTAHDEETRRFLASEHSSLNPGDAFHQQLDRAVRACLRACPQTDTLDIHFVKAGQLSLRAVYVEAEGLVKIHDGWLSRQDAAQELGLSDGVLKEDVLFHVSRWLVGCVFSQIPADRFDGDDIQAKSRHKKQELNMASQRLFRYSWEARGCQPAPYPNGASSLGFSSWSTFEEREHFEIQLHQASTCSRLRSCLLSQDVHNQDIKCLSTGNSTSSTSRGRDRTTKTCYRLTIRGGSPLLLHKAFPDLASGVRYFAIISKPSKPSSMVVVTDTFTCEDVDRKGRRISTSSEDLSESSSPWETMQPPSSSRSPPASASPSMKTTQAKQRAAVKETIKEDSYTPGSPLDSLDILVGRDWFEAGNAPNGRVVIGVARDGSEDGRARKRQRRT